MSTSSCKTALVAVLLFFPWADPLSRVSAAPAPSQPVPGRLDAAAVQHAIDASVAHREDDLLGYTAVEHYSVFRSHDTQHPVAEMTVKATYRKETGKSYQILAQSGSAVWRKELLDRVLDNEKTLTRPENRMGALITSANYTMTPQGTASLNGRDCYVLTLAPRRESPYLFKGSLWVDAQDGSIVQLQGVTSRNPSLLAGPTNVERQYTILDGMPMATHALATSNSWLLGLTTISIDYTGYELQLSPATASSR